MKDPAILLMAKDWLTNVKLRSCTPAARGAWIDVICLMTQSGEYGVIRWPLSKIARTVNVPIAALRELADADVLKGSDDGAADCVHVPRHAGKSLEPVTLLVAGKGACWYSSRMLRDEWRRQRAGLSTRFTTKSQPTPPPTSTPSRSPSGREGDEETSPSRSPDGRTGDGPAVAVAFAVALKASVPIGTADSVPGGTAEKPPQKPPSTADPGKDEIWRSGRALLEAQGQSQDSAGSFLGKLCKDFGPVLVLDAVRDCVRTTPAEAKAWLTARCQERRDKAGNKATAIEQRNRTAVEVALREAEHGRV